MRTLHASVMGAGLALALLGCMTHAPAPVEDRRPPAAKAASAAASPTQAQPDSYVVKRGDTLYSIALDNGVDWRELAALNQLSDPTKISVGQVLRLRSPQAAEAAAPSAEGGVIVSPIVTAPTIAARPLDADAQSPAPPATAAAVSPTAGPATTTGGLKTEPKGVRLPYSDENLALLQRSEVARSSPESKPDAAGPKPEAVGPKPETAPPKQEAGVAAKPPADSADSHIDWIWPANGRLVASFDGGSNKGLDIAGRVGDPVYASATGRVVYSGEGIPAYGKLVIIRHNGTYLSAYAHNSQILVKEGQNVTKGQKIAELGSTGASQAKLHFEIRRLGKPVDPMQYLPSKPN